MKKYTIPIIFLLCIALVGGFGVGALTPPEFGVPAMTFNNFDELVSFMTNPNFDWFADVFLESAERQLEEDEWLDRSVEYLVGEFVRSHSRNIESMRQKGYILEVMFNGEPIERYFDNISIWNNAWITIHNSYSFRFETEDTSGSMTIRLTNEKYILPFDPVCRYCDEFGLCFDCEWFTPPPSFELQTIQIGEQDYTIAVYGHRSIRFIHADTIGFSINLWTSEDSELSAIELAQTLSFVLHPLDGTSPRNSICTATRPNPYISTTYLPTTNWTLWIVLGGVVGAVLLSLLVIKLNKTPQ
ncbi:MAG: hypothetical protein FWB93_06455 [Oscillospiraceae bacterium]|nr:hypothetical protein [Oscillospiraceae bacterium]